MKGHDHSAIGKRGQAFRQAQHLSVAAVAARVGVTAHRVHQWECYGVGTLDLVEQWARAIAMDPRVLAFGPAPRECERSECRAAEDRALLRRLAP